ncbi:unnamed protein product [Ilex paraguariensis]|uniref:Uncharacterized protein n=1 Tax=Ilex paraguariensis TaxID=185542 RepID=A0ABC8SH24_9AQUA
MPLTLPLVSQSILFPQISQEPGVSHRSSNHPISRSSSFPQINFFGQDSSGIQRPPSIQSSLVPQTSLDSHLPVPRQSSIANVPLVDSGNSSLGNGLLTSTGIPKPAKRVVYNNGEPGMKKRIVKGDDEKGNGQNVEVNQQKEINIQSGVDHVVINVADKGKGIAQTMPGGNQKQAFKRKEVVHKPETGNRFSALAFEEQSNIVESGDNLIEPAAQIGGKSCLHEVEEEILNVSGRENVEVEGVDKVNDLITEMNVPIEVDQGSEMQMRMSKSGEVAENVPLIVRGGARL